MTDVAESARTDGYVGQISLDTGVGVWVVVRIDNLDDDKWSGRQLADDEPVPAEEFGDEPVLVTLRDSGHPRCGQTGRGRVLSAVGGSGQALLAGTDHFR